LFLTVKQMELIVTLLGFFLFKNMVIIVMFLVIVKLEKLAYKVYQNLLEQGLSK